MESKPHNKNNETGEGAKVEGRRNFLKGLGLLAGAGLVAGAGVNKYIEKEKELNSFYKEYGPNADVEDLDKVSRACVLLREEIATQDTSTQIIINKSVRLSGTGHPNEKIDILRNYIFRYLTSKHTPGGAIKKDIVGKGIITVNDLDKLSAFLKNSPKVSY